MKQHQQNWYVRRGNRTKGPFPAGLVSRYVLLGRIAPTDLVSQDREQWMRVRQVPGLIPEVLRVAAANPDDEEAQERLEAARRWADERREPKDGENPDEDRRAGDGGSHRVHVEGLEEDSVVMRGYRPYLIVLAIVALVVAVPLLMPSSDDSGGAQCDAAPAAGVNWSNCVLLGRQYSQAELSGANLNNANLSGALLRAAKLKDADMAYVNLTVANLRGADLSGASLIGANLRGADLSGANLEGADLSYAILTDSELTGAKFAGAKLGNAQWNAQLVCLPGSVGECLVARVPPKSPR